MRKIMTWLTASTLCSLGLLLLVAGSSACGDGGNGPRPDGGGDGPAGDARADAREDGAAPDTGEDGPPAGDMTVPDTMTGDGPGPADLPPDAMTGDLPGGGDGGGGLGAICATEAQPGQPGSCQSPLVCCATAPAVCMAKEDCPGGNGTIQCQASGDCPTGGRICCEVPGMSRFCTQQNACADFGGTVIP